MAPASHLYCTVTVRRRWLPWFVVAIWFAASSSALWAFGLRDARPYMNEGPVLADYPELTAAAERWFSAQAAGTGAVATVVQVIRKGCRCNSATAAHVAQIRREHAQRGVAFVTVELAQLHSEPSMRALAATPSALVFDAAGRLAFLGPFSSDAWCGAGAGFVERTLDQLGRGERPVPQPVLARGCFCDTDDDPDGVGT